MFVLNVGNDGRVLSAGKFSKIPNGAVTVETLPQGDISDYRYTDGQFVLDPLPVPQQAGPSELDKLAAQIAYTAMMTDTIIGGEQ